MNRMDFKQEWARVVEAAKKPGADPVLVPPAVILATQMVINLMNAPTYHRMSEPELRSMAHRFCAASTKLSLGDAVELSGFAAQVQDFLIEKLSVDTIDMVLHCPSCGMKHIDAPSDDWDNPPHCSHKCVACGHIWRAADRPTNGVAELTTRGKNDSPPANPTVALPREARLIEIAKALPPPQTLGWIDGGMCEPDQAIKGYTQQQVLAILAEHWAAATLTQGQNDSPHPGKLVPLPITEEERQFLHYNPNTDDLVAWVQEYAARCRAAQGSAPLTDEQIVMDGLMMVPNSTTDVSDWFTAGVRFAEKHHKVGP